MCLCTRTDKDDPVYRPMWAELQHHNVVPSGDSAPVVGVYQIFRALAPPPPVPLGKRLPKHLTSEKKQIACFVALAHPAPQFALNVALHQMVGGLLVR